MRFRVFQRSLFLNTLQSTDHIIFHRDDSDHDLPERSREADLCTYLREYFRLSHHDIGEWFSEVCWRNPIFLRRDIILFDNIIHEYGSDCFDRSIFTSFEIDLFLILLILDVTEYFFEDIFHRDHSGRSSMFIDDERDMTTRLLELLEEVIEWLCQRNLHNLLEIEISQIGMSVLFSLELECLTKCDHIVDIIRRITTDRDTRMGRIHEDLTRLIDRHIEIDEFHMDSGCHDGLSCGIRKGEEVLDLTTLICLDGTTLMRHIDECIELFSGHFFLSMKVDLSSEYPSKSFHKNLYQPCNRKKYDNKNLVYWSYF